LSERLAEEVQPENPPVPGPEYLPTVEPTRLAAGPKRPDVRGACRLHVTADRVLLDGQAVTLDMAQEARGAALCLLRHLLAAGGEWQSSTERDDEESAAGKAGGCGDHAGVRWDRVRNRLPECIRILIESDRKKGYRLVPAIWHR
jgi:hypothetical protein